MRAAGFFIVPLLALSAAAQSCTQEVPISLIDGESRKALRGVSLGQLEAKSRKANLPLIELRPLRTRRLLILSDRSGSITNTADGVGSHTKAASEAALQALDDFLAELPADVAVEYGAFSDVSMFTESFLPGPSHLRSSLRTVNGRFPVKGHRSTALYDAMNEGVGRFADPGMEDAMLLLTDGGENASRSTFKSVEKNLRASHIRLFVILFADRLFQPEEVAARQQLIIMAQNTGGHVFVMDAELPGWTFEKPVKKAIAELHQFCAEEVLKGYLLSVQIPVSMKKETSWRLTLQGNAKAVVIAPDHLRPCGAVQASP
jgi:hypothetical protein